jgi:hypothetical protein
MTRYLCGSPATLRRWAELPYGLWVCASGREVIFNRYYEPLWQRVDDCVLPADSDEWVQWKTQGWFYNDADTRNHADLCCRLDAILAAFKDGVDVSLMLRQPKRVAA